MRSHGLHRVYAKERALGTSMSRLRETSTSIRQKNGGRTSTRRYFPVGTSKSLFSFTRSRRRWFSRTRLSTSSWTRSPSLGERRQSSAGCTIPAGRYSLACACRYFCSGGRQRRRSKESTLGNPSTSCSVMAGVSSPEATKSSGGYSESQPLESGLQSTCRPSISAFLKYHLEQVRHRAGCTAATALDQGEEPEASGDEPSDGGFRIAPIRNGAVASAVLVQPHALASAFWCIGTGPLRRALAGATRSGTAGVGDLFAIR